MDSRQLNSGQTAALQLRLRRMIEYLCRLRDRMKVRGFPPTDQAFVHTLLALETVYLLSKTLEQIEIERAMMMGTSTRAKREWERQQRQKRV